MSDRLPVALVTGFLGSGKTTLISALLAHPDMGETAVLVNELGEVAIDHHLVRRVDERTVVLASGCVCCTLRGDLRDELRDLLDRRARGELAPFRRVVVETTGLADPAPVLSTLLSEPVLRHHYAVEAVVATVDAIAGAATLDRHPESVKQAAVADTLLVTKADAAAPGDVEALEARLRALNPLARIRRVAFGAIAPGELLGGAARDRPLAHVEVDVHARHDHDVRAFALVLDEPLDWDAFAVWLTMLLHSRGLDVLRVKGLLDVGEPGPVVLDGVQHVVHRPRHLAAWPDGDHRTRIVFITRGIERDAVEASLRAFAGLGVVGGPAAGQRPSADWSTRRAIGAAAAPPAPAPTSITPTT
jgi:G3E family GTPase